MLFRNLYEDLVILRHKDLIKLKNLCEYKANFDIVQMFFLSDFFRTNVAKYIFNPNLGGIFRGPLEVWGKTTPLSKTC